MIVEENIAQLNFYVKRESINLESIRKAVYIEVIFEDVLYIVNLRSQRLALPPKIAMKGQFSPTKNNEITSVDMIVIMTTIQGVIKWRLFWKWDVF